MNEKQTVYNSASARAEYTKILDRAAAGERIILTKYNIPVAAMVSVQDAKRLEEMKAKERTGK